MSFTSDPQNSITSMFHQLNGRRQQDSLSHSRTSATTTTPHLAPKKARGQKGAPFRIEFKLEVEEYREKFGYKSIEELVGLPPMQLAHQLFEAQALLHDEHLDIIQTNRKRRMKEAEKMKEKKERRRRRRRSDQQVK